VSERAPAHDGAPCWIDLVSSDVAGSRALYGAVFGWEFEDLGPGMGNYVIITSGSALVGGLTPNDPVWGVKDVWTTYFATRDVAGALTAVEAAGGRRNTDPDEVPGRGVMASAFDPSGAAFSLWQAEGTDGYGRGRGPGFAVWHELATRDYAGALRFYTRVLGWEYETVGDRDDFRYSAARFPDARALASVMDAKSFLPEGVPDHWSVYFNTSDVDGATAKVESFGGETLIPARDTPYGRMAQVADATGAIFNLMDPQPLG
jgi:hypothetical protein